MDFPKREPALPLGSPARSPKAMRPGAGRAVTEADENASPKNPVPAGAASPQRKKVLGERNDGGGMEPPASTPPPQPKPAPSPTTLTGRGAGPYDPKTNYTTPRPEFLRYDPERRREILLRMARAAEVEDDDCSSSASATAASEEDGGSVASNAAAASPVSSARGSDSEAEVEDSDDDDDEEEVAQPRRGRWARRLFLLLVALACCFCYMHCMNPAALPVPSEDGVDFIGSIGGMYDAGNHEIDSLSFLGPLYMMGPEDVLEETTHQFVHRESEHTVHLHEQRTSPSNLLSATVMGLSDICLKVPFGESTCQLGDESSETADMEEGREEGEDNLNEFVMQSVSMQKAIESSNDKLTDRRSLESEELNLDSEELWEENTGEAAKAICSTVRFLWSAMEPHFLHILACLSVAGFVAGMFRYFQRSSPKSLAEVPVLIPHQTAQLPVSPSPQAVQLSVYPSEQPKELTVQKQRLSGSLPLPKLDPFVSVKDPVQKPLPKTVPVDNEDDNNMKASNGNFLNQRNVDSSKPPVVELLGEFTFAESSRRRAIKSLNQYDGDAAVQELPKKDVDKMQMNSSTIQSPSARRERKEEISAKGVRTDASPAPLTPTPLRRSSRLRNKVTTP